MLRKLTLLCILSACASHQQLTAPDINEGLAEFSTEVKHSPAIVFDAVPLTATFQRFFNTNTEVFTPQQQKDLGTISYVGETSALLNGRAKRQLDQAYVRTLRVVLLEQCQALASKEALALGSAAEGDVFAEHVLIKRYGRTSKHGSIGNYESYVWLSEQCG